MVDHQPSVSFPGRSYRMYYKDCTDYTQLTDFGGEVIAKFSVRFSGTGSLVIVFKHYSNSVQNGA